MSENPYRRGESAPEEVDSPPDEAPGSVAEAPDAFHPDDELALPWPEASGDRPSSPGAAEGSPAAGAVEALPAGAVNDPETPWPSVPSDRQPALTATETHEGWQPSEAEHRLLERQPEAYAIVNPNDHANDAYRVDFADGSHGLYKPESGADPTLRDSIPPGEYASREVAASRMDEMLGFDLVPTTVACDGPRGEGSLQDWAEGSSSGKGDVTEYSVADQQRMAVLDYIAGSTDRHIENYLTGSDGRPVAIDNGLSFPESDTDPMLSPFVEQWFDKPLSSEVREQVEAVDPAEMRAMLIESGISEDAADAAVARLEEVQSAGSITGEAWDGKVEGRNWKTVRPARP